MICLHFLSSLVGYLVGVCRVYVVSDCVAEPSIWSRILHAGTTLNMFLTACSISCVGFDMQAKIKGRAHSNKTGFLTWDRNVGRTPCIWERSVRVRLGIHRLVLDPVWAH